jgi:hypothetical protein
MNLSFRSMSESEFKSRCSFKLPALSHRRNVRVDEVLPDGEGLT